MSWRFLKMFWKDNLLGFLFTRVRSTPGTGHISALYTRALEVCSFVQHAVLGDGDGLRPQISIRSQELPRLQRLFLTSASIHLQLGSVQKAIQDYFKGVEIMIPLPSGASGPDPPYTMREFILTSFVAGYLVQSSRDVVVPSDITDCLMAQGTTIPVVSAQAGYDLFQAVRSSSDRILEALQRLGGNALPFLLLLPEQITRIPSMLFPASSGVFPAICTWVEEDSSLRPPAEPICQQAKTMTGNMFLALAKYYQDVPSNSVDIPGFQHRLNVNHALAIMFYYLALALAPAPSTYNNMGIILSIVSDTTTWVTETGESVVLSGSDLAGIYYNIGLRMDPVHPHLLTNLGSLYKDQGSLDKAIEYVSYFPILTDD